jgi:putative membrane protein
VVDLLVKVLINAIGVYVAVLVVPQIHFTAADQLTRLEGDWWKVLVVALILALVNTYLKPIIKLLSFPITLVTMGLFAFVINAVMLLLVALVSEQLHLGFKIANFPPDFSADAFIGALLGSIVISIVSVGLGLLDRGRRIVV